MKHRILLAAAAMTAAARNWLQEMVRLPIAAAMTAAARNWLQEMVRLPIAAAMILLGAAPVVSAAIPAAIRHLAIQEGGRVKPFESFSRSTIRFLTGSHRYKGQDPVATVLSIAASPPEWADEPLIHLLFVPLRKKLGFDRGRSRVSLNELMSTRRLMQMLPAVIEKQGRSEKLSMLENETWDLYQRFFLLNVLMKQEFSLVPPQGLHERVWLQILQPEGYSSEHQDRLKNSWAEFMAAFREGDPKSTEASANELAAVLRTVNPSHYPPPWRLSLEVFYHRIQPFRIASWIYLAAFLLLLIPRFSRLGMGWLAAGFLLHGAGIAMRVILGGRPPVSNFFETMLWLPFVAVGLALIFERIYRVGFWGLSAALLAATTLVLADTVPLDSGISPVVAVLRSNLWLSIHVLTVVASYGALALATVLAHCYGVFYLTGKNQMETLKELEFFLYRAIQVGVVLLSAGIMLGGVWANASWGRYWGWDPKETWALITLLWFLALLHGRFAGWLKDLGLALGTIGGFFLLLMTYYGVSFYLVGLHSYAGGNAKPLPALLAAYLAAELLFILFVGVTALSRRRFTS